MLGPVKIVQVPVPTVTGVPASVEVLVLPQRIWSGPAFATVGDASIFIITWSEVAGQGALELVH